jgi:hypothetical protein
MVGIKLAMPTDARLEQGLKQDSAVPPARSGRMLRGQGVAKRAYV